MRTLPAVLILSWTAVCAVPSAIAQVEIVRDNIFPAELEFSQLGAVRSEDSTTDRTKAGVRQLLPFLEDLGFRRRQTRVYDLQGGASLAIETILFSDARAALAALSLTGECFPATGPPGSAWCAGGSDLQFSGGNYWVRLSGAADPALLRKIAVSMGNRAGALAGPLPSVLRQLPAEGRVGASFRYAFGTGFLSRVSRLPDPLGTVPIPEGTETATCDYRLAAGSGTLTLLVLPTAQLAEDYHAALDSMPVSPRIQARVYTRRAGPFVGVLAGDVDPGTAERILGGIKYTYSIRWIYDRNNRSGGTVWGVPVALLGTVVRSLALTALLCILSIVAGLSIAGLRLYLRRRLPNNFFDDPERTGLIRLKLDEK